MDKKESKYFCTAAKMDMALVELLEKKDFEYLTVKEICERAGVNRSTFYLHYENTADLLKEATRHVINGFLAYFDFDKEKVSFSPESSSLEELNFVHPKFIMPYLNYIKENRRVFMTSLRHLGTMGFESYYNKLFKHIFDPILERYNVPVVERRYIMKFFLTGTTAVAVEWLENDCRESPETISEIIIRCAIGAR